MKEAMREAILSGEFAPGQRLVEADLCDRFATTRGNVRAALADLAAEGLVERIQNKGARVRVVSLDEAIEITECRMVLEGLCAAKAAERAGDADIAELRRLGEKLRAELESGDLLAYSDLGHRLHERIRAVAGQGTAAATLERLRAQLVRYQFRLALQPGRPKIALEEHLRVVEAIGARDPAAAEAAMREHLCNVIEALRR